MHVTGHPARHITTEQRGSAWDDHQLGMVCLLVPPCMKGIHNAHHGTLTVRSPLRYMYPTRRRQDGNALSQVNVRRIDRPRPEDKTQVPQWKPRPQIYQKKKLTDYKPRLPTQIVSDQQHTKSNVPPVSVPQPSELTSRRLFKANV